MNVEITERLFAKKLELAQKKKLAPP